VRRLADRLVRRAKQLIGRPDPSPWVLLPDKGRRAPGRGGERYADFMFGLDYLSNNARLARLFHEAMAPYGLSVLLVNDHNVERMIRDVEGGRVVPHVYLDLCSRPGSRHEQLLNAAAKAGAHTLRNPAHEKWTLKAYAHPLLEQAGLPMPPSVILRAGEADRELTADERRRVGDRCVIKPSFGEMARGVVANVKPTLEAITAARDYNRKFDWLVQRMMTWGRLGNRHAYVRAYNILGHRSILWWANHHHSYGQVTWEEAHRYDLLPCLDVTNKLAELSGMEFFSTEIAITGGSGMNRFCLIDYINDCCDLDPEAANNHPPEGWVKWVCERFAEFTWRKKHGLGPGENHTVYLGPAEPGRTLAAVNGMETAGASASVTSAA